MRDDVSRRRFLAATAAAAGSLVLSATMFRDVRAGEAGDEGDRAAPFAPNAFLRIERSGAIVVLIPRPEMGQGVRTSLAMLVAEELDADWSSIRVEQAGLDESRFGEQYAGGSAVVRTSWEPLRRAGATARAMLLSAAAAEWRVDASECRTMSGTVLHDASSRSIEYGALVAVARRLPVPTNVRFRAPDERRIIGRSMPGVDVPDIVRGRTSFGIDVRVPGMLFAVIERSPVFGGRARSVNDARARMVGGVRGVVRIDADAVPVTDDCPPMPNGVAVVADSTWAAMQGRRVLSIDWDPRDGEVESTRAIRDAAVEATKYPPRFIRRRIGDPDIAMAAAHRRVEAVYELPMLAHATMEPMNCTAHASGGRCELWAPTQNPASARMAVASALGIAPARVTVHMVRMGGGFGRRFYADFAVEAALVSRAIGRPAQVVWTREDDIAHDFYRPAGYHLMRAGVDARGELVAWTQHLATASRGEFLKWKTDSGTDLSTSELEAYDLPAGVVPHYLAGATPIASRIPRGQWRSVESSATVFVTQSFLAEVAHAAGKSTLDFQLDLLSRFPVLKHYGSTYETARLANVFRLAASRGALGDRMPVGWGRGIAGSYSNGAFVAHVVDIEMSPAGDVRARRVVSAIDCGTVVNPSGVRAQVEGAVIYGLSAALKQQITVERGRVVQQNFHDFDVMRMADAPQIDVHIVSSEAPVCGVGETSLPPIAPAVTNAIFNASGIRVRSLPIGRVTRP